ncbi:MAG: FAD-dependent oxidoreductase, partial [Fimbriimonadaceae bacterium]|nr:FAD-dependent oxidoreductase [Chitinophagales bacterium]
MAIKKYNRKEFKKTASLAGAGILLNACKSNNTETAHTDGIPDSTHLIKDTVPQFTIDKNILADKYDSRYEMLRQRFNKNINKYPQVIVVCRNTEDVSAAVQYAVKNKLYISIKSGGHSFEGFSVNDNGMVIDVSQMQKISWPDDVRISVEPGCTLSKLYDIILPQKRILPAGSCAGVGIGGLTLGGGYGLFSRKYGLTCDSLEALTLVDGKGNIITSKNNDELLWACRGGGNGNFGVVTEMQFKTYDAPALFQSHRFKAYQLNTERAKTILQTWFALMKNLPESCFSAFVLNGKTLTVLITNFEEHTTALQNILDALKNETDKFTLGNKIETAKALKTFYGVQTPIYFKNASAGYYSDFSDIEN